MEKNVAVVLAGCGVYDGSEIHEAVITLLNLHKLGAKVSFFAPDTQQVHTLNHLDGSQEVVARNVLVESARIARGQIAPLSDFDASKFDALIFPGGFGAAKNLCSFAFDGANCKVDSTVCKSIESMLALKKPLAFLCIAPVIAAKVIGQGVKLTIGNDSATASCIEAMGATHIACSADDFVEDEKFNVYSSPAYMLANSTAEIDSGLAKMLAKLLR